MVVGINCVKTAPASHFFPQSSGFVKTGQPRMPHINEEAFSKNFWSIIWSRTYSKILVFQEASWTEVSQTNVNIEVRWKRGDKWQVMDYQQYPSYPAPYQAYSSPYPAYSSQPNHFNLKVREAVERFFSQSCTHVHMYWMASFSWNPLTISLMALRSFKTHLSSPPVFEAGIQQQVWSEASFFWHFR